MEPARYLETSTAMRLKLAATGAASILAVVAYARWVAPMMKWIATLPACESLPWVRGELLVAVALSWTIGVIALRRARSLWRLQQTPLPSAWVWVRTRIRTGFSVKMDALYFYAGAALFLLGPVVLVIWQKLYAIFCFPQACGC